MAAAAVRVPLNDVRPQIERWGAELEDAIRAVMDSGQFELGPEVTAFEEEFAAVCGVPHAVGVHSGTAALHLALRALGVGPGDEVIVPANSDISTASAVHMAGARVRFAEIDAATYNLDPDAVAAAVTPRTRAVIAVHLYGLPAAMDAIMELAERRGLLVIEDAALATGAVYRGRRVGSIGHAGCFSFAPRKVLGAFGCGGIVTCTDGEVARRLRMLRAYGEDPARFAPPYVGFRWEGLHHEVEGWNLRLDTLQAAVLRVKLRHLDEMIAERRQQAERYRQGLADVDAVLPVEPEGCRHVYRNFTIRVRDRDRVRRALLERGIATGIHYAPPLHLQPVYRDLGLSPGLLPVTERVARELLCLPIYPGLAASDQNLVIEALREILG